jgi:hypothetical protein
VEKTVLVKRERSITLSSCRNANNLFFIEVSASNTRHFVVASPLTALLCLEKMFTSWKGTFGAKNSFDKKINCNFDADDCTATFAFKATFLSKWHQSANFQDQRTVSRWPGKTIVWFRVARFVAIQYTETGGNIPKPKGHLITKRPYYIPNGHNIFHMDIIYVYQMDITYTNIFHLKALPNNTKFGFFGLKINHLATLVLFGRTGFAKSVYINGIPLPRASRVHWIRKQSPTRVTCWFEMWPVQGSML